mmetsp:Transcript_41125/g.113354  ORF Transcript_41125/g.113354 Transcript_41125/m.113354 type:complete len:436 (-) Transcript_41125:909-2216(-)
MGGFCGKFRRILAAGAAAPSNAAGSTRTTSPTCRWPWPRAAAAASHGATCRPPPARSAQAATRRSASSSAPACATISGVGAGPTVRPPLRQSTPAPAGTTSSAVGVSPAASAQRCNTPAGIRKGGPSPRRLPPPEWRKEPPSTSQTLRSPSLSTPPQPSSAPPVARTKVQSSGSVRAERGRGRGGGAGDGEGPREDRNLRTFTRNSSVSSIFSMSSTGTGSYSSSPSQRTIAIPLRPEQMMVPSSSSAVTFWRALTLMPAAGGQTMGLPATWGAGASVDGNGEARATVRPGCVSNQTVSGSVARDKSCLDRILPELVFGRSRQPRLRTSPQTSTTSVRRTESGDNAEVNRFTKAGDAKRMATRLPDLLGSRRGRHRASTSGSVPEARQRRRAVLEMAITTAPPARATRSRIGPSEPRPQSSTKRWSTAAPSVSNP